MIQKLTEKMIEYYTGDPKRIQHFIKVHAFSRYIGLREQLPEQEQFLLECAALVHDIGIKPAEAITTPIPESTAGIFRYSLKRIS